ncbi:ribosomal protein S7 [Xylariaceae sp. FL0662B]|nr:ribosomal protein S7 [Xylariaceae sp. FL0662B]
MSSKLNPWGAVRSLSIRTRLARPARIPFLVRRGLADTTTRPPSDGSDSSIPPPPSSSSPNTYVEKPPEIFAPNLVNAQALVTLEKVAAGKPIDGEEPDGLLFGMPERPGKHEQLQDRYHPVVDQVTKLLMRDGKLSKAQRHVALILNYLRTTPAPKVSPLRPLLPGSPPPSQLPLNPVLYLALAVDSVAPLIRVKMLKGLAGGGRALEVPQPMTVRARRRVALMWILDAVRRKRSTGSGHAQFATRFGQEIVAVVEGRSGVWDRRNQVHKLGTASRANLNHYALVKKTKKRK